MLSFLIKNVPYPRPVGRNDLYWSIVRDEATEIVDLINEEQIVCKCVM